VPVLVPPFLLERSARMHARRTGPPGIVHPSGFGPLLVMYSPGSRAKRDTHLVWLGRQRSTLRSAPHGAAER
jgi:hypothetical protein